MAINAGDVVWHIGAEQRGLEKALVKARKNIKGLNKDFGQSAKNLGKKMTVAGAGVVAVLGGMVAKSQEFSKAMAEVNTLGIKDLDALGDSVKDVAGEFGLDLTDSVKAAYQAISAGATELEAPLLLEKAAIAATAGVTDLSTAIELGTSVTNAFGLGIGKAEDIFDQAFIAVKGGVTTFEELSSAVGKVAPIMSAAGVSSGEMFASIGALTKGGLATAEAVTGMKAAITGIIKPTSEASKLAESLGLNFSAAGLESQGLGGFMAELREKTGGNLDTMSKLFGSTEALSAVLALTGNQAESFNSLLGQMAHATGSSQEAFDAFVKANPGFAFQQLKSQISVLMVELGGALLPTVISLAEQIKPLIIGVTEWIKANPQATETVIKMTAAVGALMVIIGPLLIALPGLATAAGLLNSALLTLTGTGIAAFLMALAGPAGVIVVIGLAIGAVGLLIASTIGLMRAKRDLANSEIKLSATVEKAIQKLEENGGSIDKVALATMSLDDQVMAVNEAWTKNATENRKAREATDKGRRSVETMSEKLGLVANETDRSKTATQNNRTALHNIMPKLDNASTKYNAIADAANLAAQGIRNATAAAKEAGGGGGGGGGGEGRASGGRTRGATTMVGERGPELLSLPHGSRVLSHPDMMRAASSGGLGGGGGGIGGGSIGGIGGGRSGGMGGGGGGIGTVNNNFQMTVNESFQNGQEMFDFIKMPLSIWLNAQLTSARL